MKVFVIVLIVISSLIILSVSISSASNKERIRDISVQGENNSKGDILVVYRPGLSRFPYKAYTHVINTLVDADWRVNSTTISSETPTNVQDYNYVVMISVVYGDELHTDTKNYLTRVHFNGTKTLCIATSGSRQDKYIQNFIERISNVNGTVVGSLNLKNIFTPEKGAIIKITELIENSII